MAARQLSVANDNYNNRPNNNNNNNKSSAAPSLRLGRGKIPLSSFSPLV